LSAHPVYLVVKSQYALFMTYNYVFSVLPISNFR